MLKSTCRVDMTKVRCMSDKPLVMLVEDDVDLAEATAETLTYAGFDVVIHVTAVSALDALGPGWPGVILSDVRMRGMSGLDFLDKVRERAPEIPFVVITGYGDVKSAIRAIRAGAHDFLEKPCAPELLIDVLKRAWEMRRLRQENMALRDRLAHALTPLDRLIGRSSTMVDLRRCVSELASLQVDLLIAGETGTGKELVARTIHDLSNYAKGPFVAVNCGAITEADVDRELFGSGDGNEGRIAAAETGTLYLDELESMPDSLQIRLLRVLDTREVTPVGGVPRWINMRILGSVKGNPRELLAEGRLRADLFHRFSAGALKLPALRDREGDALLLFEHFATEAASRHNLPCPRLSVGLRRQVAFYSWPGNIREVRNMAERLVIGLEVDFMEQVKTTELSGGYDKAMEQFEGRLLEAALLQTGGRRSESAELLGIPRKRLYLRLRHHKLG